MEVLHERAASLDIAKKGCTACVRVQGRGSRKTTETVTRWGSMTRDVLALRDHLVDQQVTVLVMEATGDYWKPFYYVLEDAGFEMMLVNARHVKNVPGRKSDVSDAVWLARLAAHGLVRASFVPPEPIRRLRDLTRTRTTVTRERSREIVRLEKLLEDAGIKLSSVASDLTGVSARKMLQGLIQSNGTSEPAALAEHAYRKMRVKIPDLTQALTGRFTDHHAFLAKLHLDLIDQHTAAIEELTARIEEEIEPYRGFRDLICSIPGISTLVADTVVAETGADMTRFPTADHLASWAGVAPGSNQSGETTKAAACRKGNAHLKGALGTAAMSIARQPNTYLCARYTRLQARGTKLKALVASEHKLLEIIWNMAGTGELYRDPGPDFHTHLRAERTKKHALKQLKTLGYQVTLTQAS
jgi:transposase